jgi:hypothetical protein
MIVDKLTLFGLLVTSLFALMPIMMGREFIRVRASSDASHPTEKSAAKQDIDQQAVTQMTSRKRPAVRLIEDCVEGA